MSNGGIFIDLEVDFMGLGFFILGVLKVIIWLGFLVGVEFRLSF